MKQKLVDCTFRLPGESAPKERDEINCGFELDAKPQKEKTSNEQRTTSNEEGKPTA